MDETYTATVSSLNEVKAACLCSAIFAEINVSKTATNEIPKAVPVSS